VFRVAQRDGIRGDKSTLIVVRGCGGRQGGLMINRMAQNPSVDDEKSRFK
jgi:hypothetical protein